MRENESVGHKIANNPEFLPSIKDSGCNIRADTGLIFIGKVFNGQTIKSFEQLRWEFDLPTHDRYKSLQLRHFLKKHRERRKVCKKPSKLEEPLMSFKEEETNKKYILKTYKALQRDFNENNRAKEKQELETSIIKRILWRTMVASNTNNTRTLSSSLYLFIFLSISSDILCIFRWVIDYSFPSQCLCSLNKKQV